ncbi:hypothetical protein CBM2634_A110003 [Cupriavidus taiwanensis]|uniref:Uncharacterized protein n=1 Tax=Cupriavidus taiwanensis TaxID=164546 RepID=A0A375IYD8_9BURK|nr:hypothetical protein CBM2634_A110003 [Cupriavidus taiwanensis]
MVLKALPTRGLQVSDRDGDPPVAMYVPCPDVMPYHGEAPAIGCLRQFLSTIPSCHLRHAKHVSSRSLSAPEPLPGRATGPARKRARHLRQGRPRPDGACAGGSRCLRLAFSQCPPQSAPGDGRQRYRTVA